MEKESIYQRQLIDCNCNDCIFMIRDFDKTNYHKNSYKGTGLSDNCQYGSCTKLNKEVYFSPNTCQIETQKCFKHRKDE